MRGGFKIDLVDLRARVRTERYRIDTAVRGSAVAALEVASADLAKAMDRYKRWTSARLDPSEGSPSDSELEALLSSLKHERSANTEMEAGKGGFKTLARKEVDAAEKAWRDARKAIVDTKGPCLNLDDTTDPTNASPNADDSDAILAKCDEYQVAIATEKTAKATLNAIAKKELAFEAYFRARDRVGYYRRRYYTEFAPQISLALMAEVGARTADVDSLDLWQSHFVGGRIYYRGQGNLNGMFLDVGWGVSENLPKNTDRRIKFRTHIPFRYTQQGTSPSKAFIGFEVDSDFRDGDDEVRLVIGNAVDTNRILSMLGLDGL